MWVCLRCPGVLIGSWKKIERDIPSSLFVSFEEAKFYKTDTRSANEIKGVPWWPVSLDGLRPNSVELELGAGSTSAKMCRGAGNFFPSVVS
jgi:hypothetical protein